MTPKLFIRGIPTTMTKAGLRKLFAAFGKVVSVYIPIEPTTATSKGCGFVEMSNELEARAAIRALLGKRVDGHTVFVSHSKSAHPTPVVSK